MFLCNISVHSFITRGMVDCSYIHRKKTVVNKRSSRKAIEKVTLQLDPPSEMKLLMCFIF